MPIRRLSDTLREDSFSAFCGQYLQLQDPQSLIPIPQSPFPNTVGYITYNLKANTQDIGGVPFLNCGGTELDIQNIKLSDGYDGADWIMVFDVEKDDYETYTWVEELWDRDGDKPLGYAGWGDRDGYIVKPTVTIQPGQGFWIYTRNANTVTIAGQVCSAKAGQNTQTLLANTQDILAALFPVTTDIQDIKLSDGYDGADWIMVFDVEKDDYETYTWVEELWDRDGDKPLGYAGWGDRDGYIVKPTVTIKPGQGFWIYTRNANTVTFTSIKDL